MQPSKRPQLAPLLQIPINQLFIPRPLIPYWKPQDRSIEQRTGVHLDPTANYMHLIEREESESGEIKEPSTNESLHQQQRSSKALQKHAQNKSRIAAEIQHWSPERDSKIDPDSNPYKSLIVARLSYETTEKKLGREFERFGPVRNVRIVRNVKSGKSRGYAFVEFEREKDMRCALRDGNGLKIDGKRVLVDVEYGRTKKDWLPRRFGGGLGTTRLSPTP